jgi:hypothetical protein
MSHQCAAAQPKQRTCLSYPRSLRTRGMSAKCYCSSWDCRGAVLHGSCTKLHVVPKHCLAAAFTDSAACRTCYEGWNCSHPSQCQDGGQRQHLQEHHTHKHWA